MRAKELLAAGILLFSLFSLRASEVQRHGLTFEGWLADMFFDGHRAAGPTDKWDIPAPANTRFGGVPVNPKAAKYGQAVGLGDALRQFDIKEPFLLVVGFWEQDGDTKKFVQSVAARITPEQWRGLWGKVTRADLEELDRLVKDTSRPLDEVRREALARKRQAPFADAVIQINPKIDRSQRRLQCSISFARLFDHLAPGADRAPVEAAKIFGKTIPDIPASPPRSLPGGR
mgnify:CR=1 FL=1